MSQPLPSADTRDARSRASSNGPASTTTGIVAATAARTPAALGRRRSRGHGHQTNASPAVTVRNAGPGRVPRIGVTQAASRISAIQHQVQPSMRSSAGP